jgi:glycerol-3-phosphate dehydrogenase subunit B
MGGIQLGQGSIDVLGYTPRGGPGLDDLVQRPFDQMEGFIATHPSHPYSLFDPSAIKASVDWIASVVPDLLLPGDGENHLVPTALGAMRPTYLAQPSMKWPNPTSVAVVGPRQIKDFYPELVAANLEKTAQVKATAYHIDLPARETEVDSTGLLYALALDDSGFLTRFADLMATQIGDEEAICLPAILGLRVGNVHSRLVEALGRPVIETLLPPPSIPGMRLNEALIKLATRAGVTIILGSRVTGFHADSGRITSVVLHQAGHDQVYSAQNFVYAPGGFESGALTMASYGKVKETVFDLPIAGLDCDDLITGDYWSDQKLFSVGVAVNSSMRPIDSDGNVIYDNLYAVGGLLVGAIRWTEKSGDGIAIASAVRAADTIVGSSHDADTTD